MGSVFGVRMPVTFLPVRTSLRRVAWELHHAIKSGHHVS